MPTVQQVTTATIRDEPYYGIFVKSEDSHRAKALLSARDQLVRNKRTVFGQIRGLLRPFGIKLASRQGPKRFDEAARR